MIQELFAVVLDFLERQLFDVWWEFVKGHQAFVDIFLLIFCLDQVMEIDDLGQLFAKFFVLIILIDPQVEVDFLICHRFLRQV